MGYLGPFCGNLMITTLFDDNIDDEDTPVDGGSTFFAVASDDDMMTRRVRAKQSDNEQIKTLTYHVVSQ